MKASEVAVYVDPFSRSFEGDRLFDERGVPGASDNALAPFVHLREWLQERGIEVHTADMLDDRPSNGSAVNIYLSLGLRNRYARLARRPDVRASGFFAFECPVNLPALYAELDKIGRTFNRVFSYSTEDALRPFLRGPVRLTHFMLPQSFDDVHQAIWDRRDRQFLVMVNTHKRTTVNVNELYTDRLRAIAFFNRYGEIDVYGRDWDRPPGLMGSRLPQAVSQYRRRARINWERVRPSTDPLRIAARQAYRGPLDVKADTVGRYTFAVCFENSALEGWITEKIFDCFFAGTVPIYWGAPDIDRWIPPECFIDMRHFDGYEDLREFMLSRTLEQIDEYRVAARDFIRSDGFRPFSRETFSELVGKIVEEDTGLSL